MSNELATASRSIAPVNVAALLTAMVDAGVTADAASAMKELVLLQEHQEDREAKRLWLEAFSRVRSKLATVSAVKAVPDRNGNARWYYAPLEDLQDACEPILAAEDLTIRFDSTRDGAICTGICWLSHIAGHEESSKCAINTANAQGGDLGALKIAKRGAMVAMLALKTRADSDARVLGDFVSPDMASELRDRLLATGRDERRFLALAGVNVPPENKPAFDDWRRIRQGKIGVLHQALTSAESAKKPMVPQEQPAKHPPSDPIPANVNVKTGEVIEPGQVTADEVNDLFKAWAKTLSPNMSPTKPIFAKWARTVLRTDLAMSKLSDWTVDALDACREEITKPV